jgi:hypothetical protein
LTLSVVLDHRDRCNSLAQHLVLFDGVKEWQNVL